MHLLVTIAITAIAGALAAAAAGRKTSEPKAIPVRVKRRNP